MSEIPLSVRFKQFPGMEVGDCIADVEQLERELIAAQQTIAQLQDDQAETRKSHAKICRHIKKHLGYENWPEFKGDFVTFMLSKLDENIAQRDGEIQRLKKALGGTLEFMNQLGHYDKPAYKQGEKALSTPPSAVVPWEVVIEYITERDKYENMHTINLATTTDMERCEQMGKVNVLASKLQSYAPKGK